MSRISFVVTESERAEIEQYVKAKKRWRDPAGLARDAVWQLISRNPVYAKKGPKTGSESSEGAVSRFPAESHYAVLRSGIGGKDEREHRLLEMEIDRT